MDISKFLYILNYSCLYFPSLEVLSENDPFEGVFTYKNVEISDIKFEDLPRSVRESIGVNKEEDWDNIKFGHRKLMDTVKYQRKRTFVNSWHAKPYESMAMWKQYLQSNEGIAIQSSFSSLVYSLEECQDVPVYIGMVGYVDYEKATIPVGNMMTPYFYKRKSFEHESELRALVWDPAVEEKGESRVKGYEKGRGICLPVNVDELIECVYVSPASPAWVLSLVQSLVDKLGYEKPVVQSTLGLEPPH